MARFSAALLALSVIATTRASVTPIGPFTGDLSDPLNYPGSSIVSSFDIFNHAGNLHSFNGQTLIHYLTGESFAGDVVTPRTGSHILGFTQGPGIFQFTPPVLRFGAYFNNDSGADNATAVFRDAAGNLIDTQIAQTTAAGDVWTWNGWQSTTPISTISVTGNGVLNGFLWFDDLEISYTPEPSAAASIMLAIALARLRR